MAPRLATQQGKDLPSNSTTTWDAYQCRRAVRVALDLSGWVWRAAGWAQWVDVPPWSAGGVVACRHRAAREAMARRLPVPARQRINP
jgi:hypothetical protein